MRNGVLENLGAWKLFIETREETCDFSRGRNRA